MKRGIRIQNISKKNYNNCGAASCSCGPMLCRLIVATYTDWRTVSLFLRLIVFRVYVELRFSNAY